MANRYWVGGTGNWSDNTNHWSDTSGGSPGASKPTSADNVYFDENSFTAEGQTVTINETANCLGMDWTGATNNPTLAGTGALNIYGSLTFIPAITMTYTGSVTFAATAAGKTITMNGVSFASNVNFLGSNGGWTFQDAFNAGTAMIWLQKGTLNTNGKTVTCGIFSVNETTLRGLILGASQVNISGNWNFTTTTNLTFDAGTSTIILTGNSKTFAGGGLTYHDVRFSGTPTTVTGANTFNTLTVDPGKTCKLPANTTQTASALEWDGATIQSSTAGTPATVSVASGTVTMTGGNLKDIAAEGGATFIAIGVEDLGGNDGWTFYDGDNITLASTDSSVDDFYNDCTIEITAGTGAGQSRTITDYNGTTKVATITPLWDTVPDNTSRYIIYSPYGLGSGKVLGLHYWRHSAGGKMVFAHDKNLYLLSGGSGSIAKSSQEDWDEGTCTNLDTASSPGDVKLYKGTDFTETDTATADFNGTNSHTVAASDKISLELEYDGTGEYSNDQCTGGTVIDYGFSSQSNAFDNNEGTVTDTGVGYDTNDYIGYDFGTEKRIRRVRVVQDASNRPSSLLFEYSDNNNDWTNTGVLTVTSADQTWNIADNGEHRYWRLRANSSDASNHWIISEIEMMILDEDIYYTSGTYEHPVQNPSGVVLAGANSITYNTTIPSGTSLTVEVAISTDEGETWGAWVSKNSGDSIVASGTDISLYRIKWRARLTTTNTTATPSLNDITVSFTAIYYIEGVWISPVYDLENTPLTATLSWAETKPEGTSITWYARSSRNGTVFGDWRQISASGDAIPLSRYVQVKIEFDGTASATPTVSSLLINYTTSYTAPYQLDVGPLGRTDDELTGNRVRMVDYEDWLLCADGLRPFMLYVTDDTQETDTAQAGGVSTITLKAGASAVDGFYNNAFITITDGTGAGQIRWISGYNGTTKVATVSTAWATQPDNTSGYSIGSAIKARNLGVDPPANAPTLADSGTAGSPNGTYYYKVTGVNKDGFESNPSPASNSITVSSKKITVTQPADMGDDQTLEYWKIYRTAAGGAVYKYVAQVAIGTTTYSDNTADSALGSLMLDNNNIPGNASLVYEFNGYAFYGDNYDLWFSKVGAPDQVPNITGDIQVIPMGGRILDIKSNPMALIPMGETFIAPITSSSGFVFDSDPTVDTTTMRVISKHGSLSAEASDICIDKERRENIVFLTNVGLKMIQPGWQEQSLDGIPLSYEIQPYLARAINRDQAAGVFFGPDNYYLLSFEYMAPGAAAAEWVTFALDFRTMNFYGPWTFGMSCYAEAGTELYAGDAENGIIYKMFTGNAFGGNDIEMIVDLPVIAPEGQSRTYDFREFMVVVSADSDTTDTVVKPKVDDQEASVALGALTSTFTGDERPGHNSIRSRFYPIPLAQGHGLSMRIVDNSANPLTVYEVVTRGEVLPLDD
jgi:hypothetical protein